MPLDRTGNEYAAMLFQREQEAILENQKGEMQAVVVDFGKPLNCDFQDCFRVATTKE